ncbi:MAG: EAL domain-containing protein [Anaerovoracaceae bacterium]
MKRHIVSFVLVGLLILQPVFACAETASGTTIFIAGNPDWYPIEYYDETTGRYQGVLPDLYAEIAEDTGTVFSYVDGGSKNTQQRLARNKQVDVISAHVPGTIRNLQEEYTILSYEADGEPVDVCIGFTTVASAETIRTVKDGIAAANHDQILRWVLEETAAPEAAKNSRLLIYFLIFLLMLCLFLFILFLKGRRERRQQREKLQVDSLTGIGNAAYFRWCFDHQIMTAARSLYYIAFISVAVEQIEKYFGEVESEQLQKHAASVISAYVTDHDFAARISDGVFALAFQSPDKEKAGRFVSELLIQLNGLENDFPEKYKVQFRAGIYSLEGNQVPCEIALNNARHGCIEAEHNKQAFVFTDDYMLNREAKRRRLKRKLTDALKNQEFKLYLQFIVGKDGKICGAETLTRWLSPEEGTVTPGNYIEELKDAGIISKLDFFVFEEACKQLEDWSRGGNHDLWLTCNFTRITVSAGDFLPRIQEITKRYSFNPGSLILEITEDSLAENETLAMQNVLACKKEGFRIALDDFGSGYTSFSDLCDYPIDLIKVDKDIIKKASSRQGAALLRGICELAHNLNIQVLCEGIETEKEDITVKNAGCDYIQGFYYSRVYPQDDAMVFCARKKQEETKTSFQA